MRILFLGGTGVISTACSREAIEAGHEVAVLNRGLTANVPLPDGVEVLHGDVRDADSMRAAVHGRTFDVVVDWLAFVPEHIGTALSVFRGTGQYVFISSASAYESPPSDWLVSESRTPLVNPFWKYSREKIACEQALAEQHETPWTIVRPSHTYGPSQLPLGIVAWSHPYTSIARMRAGRPTLVIGDGTSLWTLTHNSDFARGFVPLLGNDRAIGEDFHITSDEALTWNQITAAVAAAAGVDEPPVVHVPTDGFVAADPEMAGPLWGDKANTTVFDNSKLLELVPDFQAQVPFADGVRECIDWYDADPSRQTVDAEIDAEWDRVADIYTRALSEMAKR
jgi:nucleoside-diphosphate-sugar epimerase